MAKQNLLNELYEGLGNAVADVRQKVVEEGYFGRAVTQLDAPQWPQAQEQEQSFGNHSHVRDIEQEREQSADMDMER